MIFKIWIDDIRPVPSDEYLWAKSTNAAINLIQDCELLLTQNNKQPNAENIMIDIDHDAGEFFEYGGDYIRVLDWLEETGRNYAIRLHTMNPVGRQNMMNIIRKNGWMLVN